MVGGFVFTFTSEGGGGDGGETARKFQKWTPRLEMFYRNLFSYHRQFIMEGDSGSGGTAGVVAETQMTHEGMKAAGRDAGGWVRDGKGGDHWRNQRETKLL